MARDKKKAPAPVHGVAAAARRAKMERAMQYSEDVWRRLNPLKPAPKMKHKSYFEAVENADKKKKKLEFEITADKQPPPGFEFIPTGHPELSQECKEQSRDRDAMFFIVSTSKDPGKLDHHMNRLGYHFRRSIVEEARKVLKERGLHDQANYVYDSGMPEPIPTSQSQIDQEADAVLRDLFPRIPHTDRRQIIQHAFKKDGTFNGESKVGMAKDITLARRVQLAALAHIRHNHTRYDELLKESDWPNARKAVEKPCLDIIVKWRGDEETGRDQLDEILREVIEISDSENESDEESSDEDHARAYMPRSQVVPTFVNGAVPRFSQVPNQPFGVDRLMGDAVHPSPHTPTRHRGLTKAERKAEKRARKTQQRFKRYAAAAEALADGTHQSNQTESYGTPGFVATPVGGMRSQGSGYPPNGYHAAPNTVPYEAGIASTSYGHADVRTRPFLPAHEASQDRVANVSHVAFGPRGHGSPREFIRVPDTEQPKVGSYSAHPYTQRPQPPLSPVRLGLQDMALPSIEPKSPAISRDMQDTPPGARREPHQFAGQPLVGSRDIAELNVSRPSPRSTDISVNADEFAAKRRRIITYFPEDYQRPLASYGRAAPRGQDENLRRPQIEYHTDRQPLPSRGSERVVYQDNLYTRVVRSEGNHGAPYAVDRVEAPPSSRANPIVVNGNGDYEGRRIVEVRGSPPREIYRPVSPRAGDAGLYAQGVARPREPTRVVYVDDPSDRFRDEQRQYRPANHHAVSGPPAYPERLARAQSPVMVSQAHGRTTENPSRYAVPYEARVSEPQHTQSVGTTSSGIRPSFPDMSQQQRFTVNSYDIRSPREYAMVHQSRQRQNDDNAIYRQAIPSADVMAGGEYQRAPQRPFPVYPAPSSYVDIRGPSSHQRVPGHRDIIYVE